MAKDKQNEQEANYYPVDLQKGFDIKNIPESNLVPVEGGSKLKSGYIVSSNYSAGNSGWKLHSDGTVEIHDLTVVNINGVPA